jgi:uncharacterized protein involved in outer membrane biogenesis
LGLEIGEPGKEQIGFERLYANLQLDSLWTKTLHLADIELDKSKTEILFGKDGKLNLLGLFKLPQSEPNRPIPMQNRSRCASTASSWPVVSCTSR